MENATKALLIAAAVLIVIVIIALGVALVNSGSEGIGQAESVGESTAVQAFNGQFKQYIGNRQSAATVRALITAVRASNNNNASKVQIYSSTTPNDFDSSTAKAMVKTNNQADAGCLKIQDGKYYSVWIRECKGLASMDDMGRIQSITIVEL